MRFDVVIGSPESACASDVGFVGGGGEHDSRNMAEIIAAEGSSGRPAGVSLGDHALLALVRLARRRPRAALDDAISDPPVPIPPAVKDRGWPHPGEIFR